MTAGENAFKECMKGRECSLLAVLLLERGRAQVAERDGGLATVVREQLELAAIFAVLGYMWCWKV